MLTPSLKLLVALSTALSSTVALAGPIVVAGDANILDRIGITSGNDRLLDNLLGSGTTVGVLSTTPTVPGVDFADDHVVSHYGAKPICGVLSQRRLPIAARSGVGAQAHWRDPPLASKHLGEVRLA